MRSLLLTSVAATRTRRTEGDAPALKALDLLVLEHGLEHVSEQVFRETQCRKALRERNHLPEWEMLRPVGVPSKAQIGSYVAILITSL